MKERNGSAYTMWPFVFLGTGFLSAWNFYQSIYFPIWVSVFLMALVALYFMQQYRKKRAGVLIGILLLAYLLPFIHIPSYIWYDFGGLEPSRGFGGLQANPYMFDEAIIKLTAMIGVTGALGIAFGISLNRKILNRDFGLASNGGSRSIRGMSTPIWLLWTTIGLGFSVISAPQETIFAAQYGQSAAINQNWNFSSAWMISYIILTYSFVDALLDSNSARRLFKWNIILVSVAYIVIWLQLLRGDRESLPWILALGLVYFYWAVAFSRRKRNKINMSSWFKVMIIVLGIVLISSVIGSIRHDVTDANLSDLTALVISLWSYGVISFEALLSGTWSAVLLTPLSVAGDHINGTLPVKWGRDYVDIVLSLPPGFVADSLDYQRPLDGTRGAAWEMRYGIGGIHASVLPFMNFSMIGVFLIPAIWSYILVTYEKRCVKKLSVINLTFLASVVMAAPHWLWYGEKAGINAVIIWAAMAFFYKIALSLGKKIINETHGSPLPEKRAGTELSV